LSGSRTQSEELLKALGLGKTVRNPARPQRHALHRDGAGSRTPSFRLAKAITSINADCGNLHGRTNDIVGIGAQRSEMQGLLRAAAAGGRTLWRDNQLEIGIVPLES